MQVKFKYFFILSLLFSFLGFFALKLPGFAIGVYFFFVSTFLLVALVLKDSLFRKVFNHLLNDKTFWLLMGFYYFGVWGSVISVYNNAFYFSGFLSAFVGGLGFSLLIYLMMVLAFESIISFRHLIKIVFLIFLAIYVFGLLEFILGSINPDFFDFILFVRNRNSLVFDAVPIFFKSFDFVRIANIFDEPSNFAYFIILTTPIVYALAFVKEQIFKNKTYDFYLKRLLFILLILNFILTQSAGFYFVAVVLLIIFGLKKYLLEGKNFESRVLSLFLLMVVGLVIGVLGFFFLDYLIAYSTPIERIMKIVSSLNDFDALVIIDNSFANRVVSFVNCFSLFLQNPLVGVGYGNLSYVIADQLLYHSPLPLTQELKIGLASKNELMLINPSIFFRVLSETGLTGFICFYAFLISLSIRLKKVRQYYVYIGLEADFIQGLEYFILLIILTSIYSSNLNFTFLWIFLGLGQAIVLYYSSIARKVSD